ncbi:MAG TPA: M56 family metallopeptidase [Acidobacteriota bacterium]|nr:M56 family metallopeptidase [Acidobacteriota bacterium]
METFFNVIVGVSHDAVTVAAHGIWLGILLGGLVWGLRLSAKSMNAATGYLVWWSALILLVAVPLVIGGPGTDTQTVATTDAALSAPISTSTPLHVAPLTSSPEIESPIESVRPEPLLVTSVQQEQSHPAPSAAVSVESHPVVRSDVTERKTDGLAIARTSQTANEAAREPAILPLLARLLPVSLLAVWFCIAAALIFRLWQAYRRMVSIKRTSAPLDGPRRVRLDNVLDRVNARRTVDIRTSSAVTCPVAAGLGRPIILIPRHLVDQLSDAELDAVVRHELAHLVRWDDWTKLGQRMIEALFFFNPAVHWIGRRLDLERELACDALVVEQLGCPVDYARCLTRLTHLATVSDASLIPGALTSRKQIFRRFERLLSHHRTEGTRLSRPRLIGSVIAVVAVAAGAVHIAPAVGLPIEQVTFTEFSDAVQAYADRGESRATVEPDEATIPEPPDDEGWVEDDIIPVSYVVPDPVEEPELSAMTADPGTDTDPAPEMLAVNLDTPIAGRAPAPVPDPDSRVLDWDDKVFDLPITGTIHSSRHCDGKLKVWIDEKQEIRAALSGKIEFAAGHRDVRSISDDGFLAIKEEHGDVRIELDVRPSGDGLAYAYYVDGKRRTFDADARLWLEKALRLMVPEILTVQPPAPVEHVPEPVRSTNTGLITPAADWRTDPFEIQGKGVFISLDDDGETTVAWSDGRDKIKIEMYGRVEFSDDDRSIESISDGGFFHLWVKEGSQRHELYVEPDDGDGLRYDYSIDGQRQKITDDAPNWLAGVVLDVIRRTGVGAEKRARRIMRDEGVDGVLAEVGEIKSDYVSRAYLDAALDSDRLERDDYRRILDLVARQIDSDYEKAELLVNMADEIALNSDLISDYVRVVATIDSDYETRRALSAVSIDRQADPEVVAAVLEIAADMDSDYEKAQLLIDIADNVEEHSDLIDDYVAVVETIDSDYETRRALEEIGLRENMNPAMVVAVLGMAGDMDSDYEKAELLMALAPFCSSDNKLLQGYVNAVAEMDSDYEARRVLQALSLKGKTDPAVLATVLRVAVKLDSDYETAELLVEIAPLVCGDVAAVRSYLEAVAGIDSDYETKRSLAKLIDGCDLDDDAVLAILAVVKGMSSDSEMSAVLKDLVKYCRDDDRLEAAFLDVVESMGSDYEIQKLYTALYRRGR